MKNNRSWQNGLTNILNYANITVLCGSGMGDLNER